MRKILSLILISLLCLSICACGVSKEKVEEDLQGTWEYAWYASAVGIDCSLIYEFDDGDLTKISVRDGSVDSVEEGFYIITDKEIEIWFYGEEDPYARITYTYEDKELTLVDYGDGSVEKEFEKID